MTEKRYEIEINLRLKKFHKYRASLRIDTHFADIHGFMNFTLVGADESDVHKTMNVSKVSVNPYIYINFLLYTTTY